MALRLAFDPIKCDGRGVCAELLPERIKLDDWGFAMVSADPIGPELLDHAKKACSMCPVGALSLIEAD